jgi:hypothetical protein
MQITDEIRAAARHLLISRPLEWTAHPVTGERLARSSLSRADRQRLEAIADGRRGARGAQGRRWQPCWRVRHGCLICWRCDGGRGKPGWCTCPDRREQMS